jgi:hypothetical protein
MDNFDDRAKQAGGTAGTVAAALSGAKFLGDLVPIPFVGPVVGAVVGGVVGSEVGRRLGKAVIDGGSAFVKTPDLVFLAHGRRTRHRATVEPIGPSSGSLIRASPALPAV